jgi:hypothetical protein
MIRIAKKNKTWRKSTISKKHASTSNQKMMNDTADVFKMILTTNGVVDLGD